jgi:hypothetical protein
MRISKQHKMDYRVQNSSLVSIFNQLITLETSSTLMKRNRALMCKFTVSCYEIVICSFITGELENNIIPPF